MCKILRFPAQTNQKEVRQILGWGVITGALSNHTQTEYDPSSILPRKVKYSIGLPNDKKPYSLPPLITTRTPDGIFC